MFSTTSHLTASSDAPPAYLHAAALSSVDAELAELRMLTRAGEMHPRDAAILIDGLEQQIARRDARRGTLGAAASGPVSTLDLESWHGDDHDHESSEPRVELQAHGLL